MSQKQRTPSNDTVEEVASGVDQFTPFLIIEAIATQLERARDAGGRVDREGTVVRDTKGSVIPHPAIKIEADAQKRYTDLMNKYGSK